MKTPKILKEVSALLDKSFRAEFRAQGHSLTGAAERSIRGEFTPTSVTGDMVEYGYILNSGVQSTRIPYSGRSGRGGTSQYIQGLITFFKLRGLSDSEAKGAAFATANKHRLEGMSTAASSRFSRTGKRQGFIDEVVSAKEPEIDRIVSSGMDEIFNQEYNKQKSETI